MFCHFVDQFEFFQQVNEFVNFLFAKIEFLKDLLFHS